jgi:AAA domain
MPQGAGRVVYISGEGTPGLLGRIEAGASEFGVSTDTVDDRIRVSGSSGSMTDPADVARWCADIEAFRAEQGPPLQLIVLDTQARNFGPGNEDKAEDMNRFLIGVEKLGTGALMLLVHHSGHGDKNRGRGSSAELGALDVAVRVAKLNAGRRVKLTVPKPKDFEPGSPTYGAIVGRRIPGDAEGKTAAVFTHNVFEDIVDDSDALLDFLEANPKATHAEIGAHLKATLQQVKTRLKQLTKAGRLERGGTKTRPEYRVIRSVADEPFGCSDNQTE